MEILLTLALVLIFARIFGELSEQLGQPAMLGEILAGIILGPLFLGWVEITPSLEDFALLGVVFLMVLAGLKVSLKEMEQVTVPATLVAIIGAVLPLFLGIVVGSYMGFTRIESMLLAVALSVTASAVATEMLAELKILKTKVGETLIAAGVIDDVIGIILLSALIGMITPGGMNSLIIPYLVIGLFFVLSLFAGYRIFPKLMHLSDRMKSPEARSALTIIFVLLLGAMAEFVGLHALIGAFIAGLSLNHYMTKKDKWWMTEDIRAISEGFLTPIFFVFMGLLFSAASITLNAEFLIYVLAAAIIGKVGGGFLGAVLTKHNTKDSMAIGVGMNSRGVIALVVAEVGRRAAISQPELFPHINILFSTIVLVAFITTVMSVPLLKTILKRRSTNK